MSVGLKAKKSTIWIKKVVAKFLKACYNNLIKGKENPMIIHITDIDYDVSDEELDFADDCHAAIVMPKEMEVELDEDDLKEIDDLDDYLANYISDETGWCINSFNYSTNSDDFNDEFGNAGECNSAHHDLS